MNRFVQQVDGIVVVKQARPRAAARRETAIHQAADRHVARLSVAARYAFAEGRRALGRPPDADRAAGAVRAALADLLPGMLLKVFAAGGRAAARALRFRAAAFDPDKPRDEYGRWTDEGSDTSTIEFKAWFEGSKVFDDEGKPIVVHHSGSFDEQDEKAPVIGSEGMHFGTEEAAQQRVGLKDVDDLISEMTVEQDENGRWHWDMEDGTSSWDTDEEGFDTAAEAQKAGEQDALDRNFDFDFKAPLVTSVYLNIKNPMRVKDGVKKDWEKEVARAKARGYDGLVYMNLYEDKGSTSWVVFDPRQIKSIKNKGKFDKDNPLITAEALRVLKKEKASKKQVGRFEINLEDPNSRAAVWAREHVGWLIDDITQTTRERIQEAVARAQEEGDLRQQYQDVLDAVGDEERAELIARTESMTAVNAGTREAWHQAVDDGLLPPTARRQWIATLDEGVCPLCEALDGRETDMEGEYEPGVEGPPLHPRCRCTEGVAL